MGLFQLQPIIGDQENAINRIMNWDNFKMTKKISFVFFLANIVFLLVDYNNKAKGLWAINQAYCYVFYTHIVLGLVTLIYIIIYYKVKAHSASEITFVHKAYVMFSGGQLSIKTFSTTNSEVALVVSDEGSGIEQSTLDKLGTPFFTTKEQGTGLGLAVCYGIVSRHNGRISVETSPKGTTFNIYFVID